MTPHFSVDCKVDAVLKIRYNPFINYYSVYLSVGEKDILVEKGKANEAEFNYKVHKMLGRVQV